MPRQINSVIEQLKDEPQNMPIELYQVYLDPETRYLACYPEDVEFCDEEGNEQTYTAAALTRSPVEMNIESKVDQCEVTIDNVTREMSAYIAQTEFVGRRLVIWKVFLEDLSDPENYVAIFDGYMDAPQINQYQMKVSVVSKLDTLGKRLPARSFEAKCPWQFGDENTCGLDVPEKNSTIESLSEDYMKIYDSNITEENDYWKFGEVETENQKRIITASGDGFIELDFPLPQEFETGESYNMVAGCDKGYDTSHGCKYWDNTQFYGGFRTIPKQNVRTG